MGRKTSLFVEARLCGGVDDYYQRIEAGGLAGLPPPSVYVHSLNDKFQIYIRYLKLTDYLTDSNH